MDCIYSNLFIIINDYVTLKYNDDIEYIEDFYNIPYLIFISVVFVEICKMMTLQYTKVAKANLVFSSRLIIYLHKIHFPSTCRKLLPKLDPCPFIWLCLQPFLFRNSHRQLRRRLTSQETYYCQICLCNCPVAAPWPKWVGLWVESGWRWWRWW